MTELISFYALILKLTHSAPFQRNLKNKKYPYWRFDTFFSKTKQTNLKIIEDGGWHFNNLMSPESISLKLKTFAHTEFSENKYSDINIIRSKIEKKT